MLLQRFLFFASYSEAYILTVNDIYVHPYDPTMLAICRLISRVTLL